MRIQGSLAVAFVLASLPAQLSRNGLATGLAIRQYRAIAVVLAPVVANGARFAIPVRSATGLVGARARAQGMVQDPTANTAGFALTNALDLEFGAR